MSDKMNIQDANSKVLQKALTALSQARSRLDEMQLERHEPLAIVSMACRFPGGANTPDAFWNILKEGRDAVGEVSLDRWDVDEYYSPDKSDERRIYSRRAGLLDDIAGFDASFFGITPREATSLDPQQRLILETAWEALENACIPPHSLRGTDTGVFVGATARDFSALLQDVQDTRPIDAYYVSGNSLNFISGRLSYTLGLNGPSMAIDTACSSSLTALHLACQSLRRKECGLAMVGGVNLILAPEVMLASARSNLLSTDGRCKTFSAAADGIVRGEGCGMLVLQRLSEAQAQRRPILAVVRGTAVNQDGASSGLMAPNMDSQVAVLKSALRDAKLSIDDLDYIEAHGTGTGLGDPIEVRAIGEILCESNRSKPLLLGSVKTNIGHLESAAGIAGVIKTVLAMRNSQLPASLHFEQPSEHINWSSLSVSVVTDLCQWPDNGRPYRAGVSAFGGSGSNAHIVLESAPAARAQSSSEDQLPRLLTISAKSPKALSEAKQNLGQFILNMGSRFSLSEIAYATNAGREQFAHRYAFIGHDKKELAGLMVSDKHRDLPDKYCVVSGQCGEVPPRIAFLFTGQGAQYVGMARDLYAEDECFQKLLDQCAEALKEELDFPLIELMWGDHTDKLNNTQYTQPVMFSLQYALAKLWQVRGVHPDVVVGHSIGEVAAACIAGMIDFKDAIRMIARRGALMNELCDIGGMLAVMSPLTEREVAQIDGQLSIAAINGVDNIVIAGEQAALDKAEVLLEQRGIRTHRLSVSHGFHSHQMEPMLPSFTSICNNITRQPASIPFISTVTAECYESDCLPLEYWLKHVRNTVRFTDALALLENHDCDVLLEIGPDSTLLGMSRKVVGDRYHHLPSLGRNNPATHRMLESLAELYILGAEVNWKAFHSAGLSEPICLPNYPFQREPYWPIKGTLNRRQQLVGDDQYQLCWQSSELLMPSDSERSECMLIGDCDSFALDIAAVLSVSDSLSTNVRFADNWGQKNNRDVTLNPIDKTHWQKLFSTIEITDPLYILYHVVSPVSNENTDIDWFEMQRLWCLRLSAMLNALLSSGLRASVHLIMPWYSDSTLHSLALAGLHGFSNTCALEYPEIWAGLIEYQGTTDNDESRLIASDIQNNAAGQERDVWVRYFNGERQIPQIQRMEAKSVILEQRKIAARNDRSYLITGGLGDAGLLIAEMLSSQGACHLVLLSRRNLSELPEDRNTQISKRLEALRNKGVSIRLIAIDVSDRKALSDALFSIRKDSPLLAGVFHTAGVVELCDAANLGDSEMLDKVLLPKTNGAWYLHELTINDSLDYFVLYSSVSGVWGSQGLAHYSLANAFMDQLAKIRKASGLPALSVNWGPLSKVGMASGDHAEKLVASGVLHLPANTMLSELQYLVEGERSNAIVARIDWRRFIDALGHASLTRWFRLLGKEFSGEQHAYSENTASLSLIGLPKSERIRHLTKKIIEVLKQVIQLSEGPEADAPLHALGIDSLMALEIRDQLQSQYDTPLMATLIFDYPTALSIADYLDGLLFETKDVIPKTKQFKNVGGKNNGIAIVGIGCRYPGGINDLESFWSQLKAGVDLINDDPSERWKVSDCVDPSRADKEKAYVMSAGLIDDVEMFDASFFGIGPREARLMDPQQRIVLQTAWSAIEHAGIPPSSLKGSRSGVFLGVADNEYAELVHQSGQFSDDLAYLGTGNKGNVISGRLSYFLGLEGPSLAVDTACSSSAVAVHLACRSLRDNESDLVLAGGVNIILDPSTFVPPCQANMLAADGRCKSFDEKADGYVRSEGCGIVVLKRLDDAQRDSDNILAVIKGSAVNQDGRSSSLTAPSAEAQKRVIEAALGDAGLQPREITYIEAHGTGTSLGDPIEINTLGSIYAATEQRDTPLFVGSIKSNLGHCEASAGVAGLIKASCVLYHQQIPANLHFRKMNSAFAKNSALKIVDQELSLPEIDINGVRHVAVSAFGFSGTNAHLLLSQAAKGREQDNLISALQLVTVSAKTSQALALLTASYAQALDNLEEKKLASFCETSRSGRDHFEHRHAFVAENTTAMARLLRKFSQGGERKKVPPIINRRLRLQLDVSDWELFEKISKVSHPLLENLHEVIQAQISRMPTSIPLAYRGCWLMTYVLPACGIGIDEISFADDPVPAVIGMYSAGLFDQATLLKLLELLEKGQAIQFDEILVNEPRLRLLSAEGEDISRANDACRYLAGLIDRNVRSEIKVDQSSAEIVKVSTSVLSKELKKPAIDEVLLQWIAALYVTGVDIDWSHLSITSHMSIPVYPFARERYWPFASVPLIPPKRKRDEGNADKLNGFLGERVQLPKSSSVRFVTEFSDRSPTYINDHRLLDTMVVPAASHVSMMLTAARRISGKDICTVEDICLFQPLIIGEGEQRKVHLIFEPTQPKDDNKYQAELISLEPGGDENEPQAWITHVTARVDLDSSIKPCQPPVEITKLSTKWSKTISRESFYSTFWEHGYTLGKSFCWLGDGWVNNGQTLRRMQVPEINDPIEDFQLHPGLIDTCFSVLSSGQLEWIDKPDSEEMFIPVSIDKVEFIKVPDLSLPLYAQAEAWDQDVDDDRRRKEDITLFDELGVVARIIGFETRKAQREALKSGFKRHYRDDLYREALVTTDLSSMLTAAKAVPDKLGITLYLVDTDESAQFDSVIDFPSDVQVIYTNDPEFVEVLNSQQYLESGIGLIYVCKEGNAVRAMDGLVTLWRSVLNIVPDRRLSLKVIFRGLDSEVGSALQAFTKVMQIEHPESEMQFIEIDTLEGSAHVLNKIISLPVVEPRLRISSETIQAPRIERFHQHKVYPRWQADPEVFYVITGGLGGLGRETLKWLLASGAKHILLIGRCKPENESVEYLHNLTNQYSAVIDFLSIDLSVRPDKNITSEFVNKVSNGVAGIFHTAGVVDDDLAQRYDATRIESILAAKVNGIQYLLDMMNNAPPKFVVLYSSFAALLPAQGQSAYAAANACLNNLASHTSHDTRFLSIEWGPWSDTGMTAQQGATFNEAVRAMGLELIQPEAALDTLGQLLQIPENPRVLSIAVVNWEKFLKTRIEWRDDPLLKPFSISTDEGDHEWLINLDKLPPEQRVQHMVKYLRPLAAAVLGMADANAIRANKPLFDYGLDSVAAMDLRSELQKHFACKLRATLLFDYPTLETLTGYFLDDVLSLQQTNLSEVELLSEGEAEALLLAELEAG